MTLNSAAESGGAVGCLECERVYEVIQGGGAEEGVTG
jgi:hypothetical protein